MAERMGAEYVELANTQYYGWAWLNRDALMPSREQLRKAEADPGAVPRAAGQKMKIFFVVPDYFETRPKACMNGLGSVFLTVTPDGTALPCHAARMLPGLAFPNVRTDSVETIWYDSHGFNHFRGTALDEGAVPELPGEIQGLRRLPLPGLPADGRCGQCRSGVRSVSPSSSGAGGRCGGCGADIGQ